MAKPSVIIICTKQIDGILGWNTSIPTVLPINYKMRVKFELYNVKLWTRNI
jgi:hypothetical protein